MTKLATIEKIHSIAPHPNADNLSIAKIKEWPVVVKKHAHEDGDSVIFIRIDSIVPQTNSYFSFMEKQKYRVWNARFRGAPSQGLVCPLDILAIDNRTQIFGSHNTRDGEGADVTEMLGVVKYEKAIDASVCGDAAGSFPTHLISITDEDNLLNFPEVLKELEGEKCYLSVKADGSSMTVICENGTVKVCSRRLEQKEGTGFWKIAEKYNLPSQLVALNKNIAIQGEACGGKIQGNPLGLNDFKMFVFNVKDISTGEWYGYEQIKDICSTLKIPVVELAHPIFTFDDSWNVSRLQQIANEATYTTYSGETRKAEGIVLRPVTPKLSGILGKPLSLKILNQEYKQ